MGDTMIHETATQQRQPQPQLPYRVLVEFAYKHLNFQLAELSSLLELYGIRLLNGTETLSEPVEEETQDMTAYSICRIESLPRPSHYNDTTRIRNRGPPSTEKKEISNDTLPPRNFVILVFPSNQAPRWSGESSNEKDKRSNGDFHRFDPRIGFSGRDSCSIAEILYKSTLVKSVIELWGYSSTSLQDCADNTHQWITTKTTPKSFPESTLLPLISDPNQSWKFTVHTLGTKVSRAEQDRMRLVFQKTLDLMVGSVRMDRPRQEFVLIREIELEGYNAPVASRNQSDLQHRFSIQDENEDSSSPPCPFLAYYFGRFLGGLRFESRGLEKYTLKQRPYLGPTSMDAELSFVMTNLGLVKTGDVVLDPFVGTGSILLSCALRGAFCVGTDIDIRVLKGKGGDRRIWKNFDYYKLPRPEILRTDTALYNRHFRHHPNSQRQERPTSANTTTTRCMGQQPEPLYDAIITDPPYGIRAGARKSGSKRSHVRPVLEKNRHDHIAQTVAYPVSDVMSDLLDIAAQTLTLGGRLVYVIPSFQDFDPSVDLPRHDCLELVHSCYQPFNQELGRRIVAMKKIVHYDHDSREHYRQSIWVHGAESAEKCANLREKILAAAKKKPGYQEKAAIRKQKRKAHKQQKQQEKRQRKNSSTKTVQQFP